MDQDEIKTLKDQVSYCLQRWPDTRNSDRALTWKVWSTFHGVETHISEFGFMQLPTEDAIRRVRAHLQNTLRLFVPTSWEVAHARQWHQEDWQKALGYVMNGNQAEMVF